MGMRIFPVADRAGVRIDFSDDFGAPRGDHTHTGIDIFPVDLAKLAAAKGKGNVDVTVGGSAVVAVDDGLAARGKDPLGGQIATVKGADGTVWYYAHLADYAGTFPRDVKAGDVIGFVGRTGSACKPNAYGLCQGMWHLHFEKHPGRGAAVDPFADLRAAPHVNASPGGNVESSKGALIVLGVLALGTIGLFYGALKGAGRGRSRGAHGARGARANPIPRGSISAPDVVDAAEALQSPSTGLIWLPELIEVVSRRAGEVSTSAAPRIHTILARLSREGVIELRPESGLGRMTRREIELSMPGPQGSILSWARLL